MAAKLNGYAIGAIGIGSLMVYAGITGRSMLKAIQAVIQGQAPSTAPKDQPISDTSPTDNTLPVTAGNAVAFGGPVASGSAGANQALAKMIAISMGHADWTTGAEWSDWVALWDRESGWSNTADTRKTGAGGDNMSSSVFAYGIPQARNYNKMPQAAWPPDKGGSADARSQIQWGIEYIASTYGTPAQAWAHELANSWY